MLSSWNWILLSLSALCIRGQLHGGPYAHIFNRVFDLFDKNRDDVVSVDEFRGILPTADLDGDGLITKEEFVAAWESITGHNPNEAVENRHSAELLFEEVTTTTLNADDEKRLFGVFDTNYDGVISRDEFLTEWERIHPEHDDYTDHPSHPTHPTHP